MTPCKRDKRRLQALVQMLVEGREPLRELRDHEGRELFYVAGLTHVGVQNAIDRYVEERRRR